MAKPKRIRGDVPSTSPVAAVQRLIIEQCPVCGTLTIPEGSTWRLHIESHLPQEKHCEQHTAWKVDWDGVAYPKPRTSLFYCNPCGRYAPVVPF